MEAARPPAPHTAMDSTLPAVALRPGPSAFEAETTELLARNASLRAFAQAWLLDNEVVDIKVLAEVDGGLARLHSMLRARLRGRAFVASDSDVHGTMSGGGGGIGSRGRDGDGGGGSLSSIGISIGVGSLNGGAQQQQHATPDDSSNAQALLSVLFYDDRYNATRDRPTLAVYRSLDRHRVPFTVGPPSSALSSGEVLGSDGAPGDGPTMSGKLRYRPGDKVDWIMRTLPKVRSQLIFLLDTDTIWLCSPEEVAQKRQALLREHAAPPESVVLFGEHSMWPPHQQYRGTHLRLNQTAGYPPVHIGQPFRYINAGAAMGRPQDVLALHECMRERYVGFPHACPAGHTPSGELRYYSANHSWQPPVLDRPLHTRDLKYHGMRLKGSNWGWEQGCFHMYYLEQLNGELPAKCPPIVLDRAGQSMLHLAGVNQRGLDWTGAGAGSESAADAPRVLFKETGQRPCVLHANGPAKKALKPIWRWWEDPVVNPKPSWH